MMSSITADLYFYTFLVQPREIIVLIFMSVCTSNDISSAEAIVFVCEFTSSGKSFVSPYFP